MKSQFILSVQLHFVADGIAVYENGMKIFQGSISQVRDFLDHLENKRRLNGQENPDEIVFSER